MKKTYFNPEAMIIEIASEDIVRTSGGPLTEVNVAADGYDDYAAFDKMFG